MDTRFRKHENKIQSHEDMNKGNLQCHVFLRPGALIVGRPEVGRPGAPQVGHAGALDALAVLDVLDVLGRFGRGSSF